MGFNKSNFVVEGDRRVFSNKRHIFLGRIDVARFGNKFEAEVVRHRKTSTEMFVLINKNKFVRATTSLEWKNIIV